MNPLSTSYAAQSLQENAFPLQTKRKVVKCDRAQPWKQHGSNSPVVDHGEDEAVLKEKSNLSYRRVQELSTAQGKVNLNKDAIEQAVDRRVALFFMQCIVCHKMPFHFEANGADAQIGTASPLTLKSLNPSSQVTHKREAAHPSTTPCLMAYPKEEWDAYKKQEGAMPQGFIYLKGSYCYFQNNATVGVNECVNGADELLDGPKSSSGKLKSKAMVITNLVAGGELDPMQATRNFLNDFEAELKVCNDKLAETDPRSMVLKLYSGHVRAVRQLSSQPDFFQTLLAVKIDSEDPEAGRLREVVFQKRYEIIRLGSVVESRVAKRIEDVKKTLASCHQGNIEFSILESASTTRERRILEKLFGKTSAVLEAEYKQSLSATDKDKVQRFQTQVDKFVQSNKTKLENLMRDLRADFREIFNGERDFRSGLFKGLRIDYRNWTQKTFAEQFKELFPGEAMSRPMVSRLEQRVRPITKPEYETPLTQRRKDITIGLALKYAEAFGVDAGLFMPCLFASEEN